MLHKVVLSMSCMLFSATVFAGTSDITSSNNQLGIQFISTNVNYTETVSTGTLDTEKGWVPGYAVSLSTMKDWWLGDDYFEAEYDNSIGSTKYVGGLIGPPATPYGSVVSTSGATLTNYSARYGSGHNVSDEFMLTPYAELGNHKWNRGVNSGEIYTNHYYGFGMLAQFSSVSRLVFTANAMLGTTFGSYIVVNGTKGFSGPLGNSNISRVGLSADYAFTQQSHWNIGVDYVSFKYGASATYNGYYEPDSQTSYTTIKLGYGYAF